MVYIDPAAVRSCAYSTLNCLYQTKGARWQYSSLVWFVGYGSGRTEYVHIGEAKCNGHAVTSRVPQGSVLGHSLYTL